MTEVGSLNYNRRAPQVCILQKAFLGDVILTTPLIQVLLTRGCEVTLLTHAAGREIVEHIFYRVPHLHFIEVEKPIAFWKRPWRTWRLLQRYWKQFDLCLEVQRGFECGLLARGLARLWAIGFRTAEAQFLLNMVYPRKPGQHEIEKNLSLLQDLWPENVLVTSGWARATSFSGHRLARLGIHPPYGILHPGTQWATKAWPLSKYMDLLKHLRGQQRQWVVTGDKRDLRRWQLSQDPLSAGVVNVMGRLSLSEYLQVCAGADIIVANDSFATHVGSAYDVPTVTIFGSTVPEFGFGPLASRSRVVEKEGLTCRPCGLHGHHRCPENHFKCMNDISVREVVEATENILLENRIHA